MRLLWSGRYGKLGFTHDETMKRKWVPIGSRGSGKVRKDIGFGGYGRIVLLREDSLSG
jgi:hypothetical protein